MARPTNAVSEETLRQLAEEFRIWRQETLHGPAAVDDATLAAYVSGTLDEVRQRQVEEQLAASPELAEMARAVRESLEEGDWQSEGADLAPRLRLPLVVSPGAPAVERPAPVRPIWRVPRWTAVAVLVLTLLLGILLAIGPWLRDAFRVSTERLGGTTDSTLDSGITDSAQGEVNKGLQNLKDNGK